MDNEKLRDAVFYKMQQLRQKLSVTHSNHLERRQHLCNMSTHFVVSYKQTTPELNYDDPLSFQLDYRMI